MSSEVKPNWHNGHLTPTGRLTLVADSVSLVQDTTVGITAKAVDELGAEWDVSYLQFRYEMTLPLKYPDKLLAMYYIKRRGSYSSTAILANCLSEAKATYMLECAWSHCTEDDLELDYVRAPMPESQLRNRVKR